MHRDYAPQGVKFFYIYKYLAHAGVKGYVQPFTQDERLLHIKEAKRSLGTQVTWICDTMDNDLKHALGDAPTSEFVIDPEGRVVRRRAWGNVAQLRKDLEELVGPVDNPTKPEDLNLKIKAPPKVAPQGIVKRIKRPAGMKPLRIVPQIDDGRSAVLCEAATASGSATAKYGNGQALSRFPPRPHLSRTLEQSG